MMMTMVIMMLIMSMMVMIMIMMKIIRMLLLTPSTLTPWSRRQGCQMFSRSPWRPSLPSQPEENP